MIRTLLLEIGYDKAHRSVSLQLFPLYVKAKDQKAGLPKIRELRRLGDHLYHQRHYNQLSTSCLSIAFTIQALLFAMGHDAELVIGVQKSDEQLLAHAWVRLDSSICIDPRTDLLHSAITSRASLREISSQTMRAQVERWVENTCVSG